MQDCKDERSDLKKSFFSILTFYIVEKVWNVFIYILDISYKTEKTKTKMMFNVKMEKIERKIICTYLCVFNKLTSWNWK